MVIYTKRSSVSCSQASSFIDKSLPFKSENTKIVPFFHKYYAVLCKLHNIAPNSGVKARVGKCILDLCGDRLKIDEWAPIIEALKYDRNLHLIAFRSKYPVKSVLEEANTEVKARGVIKRPVLLSKFIFKLLMVSLAQCLAESTSVTCIELDGLPLTKRYLLVLCNGIAANTSLQTISFCNSPIGDEGCKQLCLLLRNMPSVLHIDLSNCDLKTESAVAVAKTLKYQTLQRLTESWKRSLRYREPNIETMPGLRRIILNNNILIGDDGVQALTDVLKEDYWIRAVDLQNCGISNVGAQSILETLDINNTLCIVDVRDNRYVDDSLLHQIMIKLFHNNANKEAHEYNWIIPRSQLVITPSNSTIRSRPNVSLKQNSSISVRPLTTNRRCMSQGAIEKDIPNNRRNSAKGIIQLQKDQSSAPQSSSAIQVSSIHGTTSRGSVPHAKEVLKKFKKPNPYSSSQTPLKTKMESKFENPQSRADKNLVSSKYEVDKNNYCLMKKEAVDAVFETFGRFYSFIEHMKKTNTLLTQENGCQGGGDNIIPLLKNNKPAKETTTPPAKSRTSESPLGSSENVLACTKRKSENQHLENAIDFNFHQYSLRGKNPNNFKDNKLNDLKI